MSQKFEVREIRKGTAENDNEDKISGLIAAL